MPKSMDISAMARPPRLLQCRLRLLQFPDGWLLKFHDSEAGKPRGQALCA
jgi:hypothetical protein